MGLRRKVRELAVGFLYQADSGVESVTLEPSSYSRHFGVPDSHREFFFDMVNGAIEKQAELDQKIGEAAQNWRVSRMARVDRVVLRMASWELFFTDTPTQVVIDEAVEISRKFSTSESASFVNGVLDRLAKMKQ